MKRIGKLVFVLKLPAKQMLEHQDISLGQTFILTCEALLAADLPPTRMEMSTC